MIVLAINTAGPACDLALLREDDLVAEKYQEMSRGQDAELPGLTSELLLDANIKLAEVDRFAVVTGPGSFTGIRIGVAFSRALALAGGKPCLGITTLEASLPEGQQGSAIVALSAQRRPPEITFWTQTFRTGVATNAPAELLAETVQALVRERPHFLFGNPVALRPFFPETQIHPATPEAKIAARRASWMDPGSQPARPTYVRAPDAVLPKSEK